MSEAGPVEAEAERQQADPAAAETEAETAAEGAETVEAAPASQPVAPTGAEPERRHAIVPVPGSRREEPRPSLWRRISMRALGRSDGGLRGATHDDRLLARLDAVASQVVESEQSIARRIEELDQKFSQVWEVEETLSRLMELRELLTEMRDRQGRVDGRLRSLERRLSFIALLAATAAVAAIAAAFAVFAS